MLSIVTVVKNAEKSITDTIESVMAQKTAGVEYIIVDGRSQDGTLAIIDRYKNRIDRFVSELDTGISDGFNKGIALASQPYVWLLNAGDTLLPDAVVAVLAVAPSGADVVYGDMMVKRRSGTLRRFSSDHRGLSRSMTMGHPATIVKKETYNRIGTFNCDFRIAMDYDFLLRAAASKMRFLKIPTPLVIMEAGGVSDTRWMRSLKEAHKIRKTHGLSPTLSFIFFCRDVCITSAFRLRRRLLDFLKGK